MLKKIGYGIAGAILAIAALMVASPDLRAQASQTFSVTGPAPDGQNFNLKAIPQGVKDPNGKSRGQAGNFNGAAMIEWGGGTPFFNDAVAGTVVQVKATIGVLHSVNLVNTTAAAAYLQIFCKPSASVTLGTTAPDAVVRMLASAASPVPLGICQTGGTGISLAGTTTPTGLTGAAISVTAIYN